MSKELLVNRVELSCAWIATLTLYHVGSCRFYQIPTKGVGHMRPLLIQREPWSTIWQFPPKFHNNVSPNVSDAALWSVTFLSSAYWRWHQYAYRVLIPGLSAKTLTYTFRPLRHARWLSMFLCRIRHSQHSGVLALFGVSIFPQCVILQFKLDFTMSC